MRRILVAAVLLPCLAMGGCGMLPKRGPEVSADQLGDPYAHQWSDADARTALWWTRNFPDDIAAIGFAFHQLPKYSRHDHRYGSRHGSKTARDRGAKYSSLFHSSADDYWANIDDPQLRVKMLALEAQERNRMRDRDNRRRTGTWPYDRAGDDDRPISRMDDAEVEQRLLERYR